MAPLLEVDTLSVTFSLHNRPLYAVRGISFEIREGESVGIVGESGCGKSATVSAIMGLTPGQVSGKILFDGQPHISPGKTIGMVFQDPMTSLNPTMKIGAQLTEGMIFHKLATAKEAKIKALELLHLVGISHPESRMNQYPHELSGGMRQRVLIAIALACHPRLLIADEPTTALDVTVQAQILALLKQMKQHFQMSLLLISHDFGVVSAICEKILVMYAGKIVERGSVEEVLRAPKHPYTKMLLNSLPQIDRPKSEPLQTIEGAPPSLFLLEEGCAFQERCPHAAIKCKEEQKGHVACWRGR
jgi:oligopeptide transport system ATP-binding protein